MNGPGNAVAQERGYGLGNTPAAVPLGEVTDRLQVLRQKQDTTDRLTRELAERLCMILAAERPPAPNKGDVTVQPSCELSAHITSAIDSQNVTNARIEDLLDRIRL